MRVKGLVSCLTYSKCQSTRASIIYWTELEPYKNILFKHNTCHCKHWIIYYELYYCFILLRGYNIVDRTLVYYSVSVVRYEIFLDPNFLILGMQSTPALRGFGSKVHSPSCLSAVSTEGTFDRSSTPGEWWQWLSLDLGVVGKIDINPTLPFSSRESCLFKTLAIVVNRACLWLEHSQGPRGETHILWKEQIWVAPKFFIENVNSVLKADGLTDCLI